MPATAWLQLDKREIQLEVLVNIRAHADIPESYGIVVQVRWQVGHICSGLYKLEPTSLAHRGHRRRIEHRLRLGLSLKPQNR
jgi:hypothetical protein